MGANWRQYSFKCCKMSLTSCRVPLSEERIVPAGRAREGCTWGHDITACFGVQHQIRLTRSLDFCLFNRRPNSGAHNYESRLCVVIVPILFVANLSTKEAAQHTTAT